MTWEMPEEFPDLSSAKKIVVDIETRDEDLQKKGPGVRRGAYIIGVTVAADDDFCQYFPICHEEGPNLNKGAVFKWLRTELRRPNQIKLGANLLYDFDFLTEEKIEVKGLWYDVQNAEPLINENQGGSYNLDALGKKYLKRGKAETEIDRICKERGWKGDPKKFLWRLPASAVGPYSEEDAILSKEIFKKQEPILRSENLWDLFLMETRLMPLLLQMRKTGVRIDVDKLDKVIESSKKELLKNRRELKRIVGFEIQHWAAESIAKAFDKFGVKYSLTPKTRKPSFTQDWLNKNDHPISKLIVRCRTLDKFIGTFLEGSIRDQLIGGRIHCLFNQLLSDEYGTVTGRFSSSHPNLQFIPVRDDEFGPLCRSMFIPEDGCDWGKADYSQIEFRIFAHYAVGVGSHEFRSQYIRDPRTDYHGWCAEEASISRREAKTVNFGIIYGMGIDSLAKNLGISRGEAEAFRKKYDEKIPFVKATLQTASERAQNRGYVLTILNRRRRFNLWEPADWELSKKVNAMRSQEAMIKEVDRIILEARKNKEEIPRPGTRRAGVHRALSAVIQGSAADLIKKAMVDCYEAGVFKVLYPHLTVHDELDESVPRTSGGREAFDEMVHLMEEAIKFKVPVVVDASLGENWGGAK